MAALIRFVLHRTVLVNLTFVIFMVVGAFSLLEMPVDRYPNINMGKVVIQTVYPGASPEEVEALVTRKIEDALIDLNNVEFIRSSSLRQRSTVVVKFLDDSDYQAGFEELRFKVLGMLSELPQEVDPPSFTEIEVDDFMPVVSVNLVGERSNQALSVMAKELRIPLRRIPGIKEVKLQGERTREYHVFVDPKRLTRLGLTFDQVAQALGKANVSVPAGDFSTPGGDFVIQTDERFRTRQQVMDTIIRTDADGSFVRVSDVATDARLGYRDPYVLSSVNGKDCVSLNVIKTESGNALSIKEQVRELLERFKPVLAKEKVELVFTRDSTMRIKDSIRTLGLNLALGVILVWLVIWYFMGFKNAVITTIGIPFSFLFTMILMYFTGNSLNDITLFSFVLVSGIIVDDAIVVVENIYRHVQQGRPITEAVIKGTSEVALPVVAATATTVAAFMPMLMMSGSTGQFFALIPKAVSYALVASLFECIFILPLHYRDFGPKKIKGTINLEEESFKGEGIVMRLLRRGSQFLVRRAANHPWISLGLVFFLFLGAVAIAGLSFSGKAQLIKVQFFPDDYSLYYVQINSPIGTPIEETNRLVKKIENFVMEDGPAVAESASGIAGFYVSEDYEAVWGFNLGHVAVNLPARQQRAFKDPIAHLEEMRTRLQRFAKGGVRITVRPEKDSPPSGKDINIRVVGPNSEAVGGLSRKIMTFLRTDPVLKDQIIDLADSRGQPSRVLHFKVLKEKTAEYGLTPAQVVSLASSVMNGRYLGKFRLRGEDVDFKLKLDPASITEPYQALTVPLLENPAGPVRLGDLCEVVAFVDTGDLNRYQGERAVTLTGNLKSGADVSVVTVVKMVRDYYEKISLDYAGATLDFSGEFESTRKSYTSLAYAFSVAILLIYLILATQFSSYRQPLIILSAVPFALIGVIFGKFITQSVFTVNSFVATVGVAGVVVNDALVLIDFLNKRYQKVGDRRKALIQAVHIRLRPILLTTLTTTLGLLPMAVGVPEYSLIWGTMATTFVTGLCTSTFLTIILVPVQWELLERVRRRRKKNDEPMPDRL